MAQKEKRIRRTPEEARALILDAAEQSIARTGPAGLRLQDVAKAAGVSHPTILHHFGSREGLVRALSLRTLDSLRAALVEGMQAPGGGGDGVARTFAAYRNGLAERLVWMLQMEPPPDAKPMTFHAIVDSLHAVRQRAARPGHEPDIADTRHVVHLTAVAALGDALMGARLRQAEGDAAGAAGAAFEKFLSDLIGDYLRRKA